MIDAYHISPRTAGGNCDWRKNPRACWPVIISLMGFNALNCSIYFARSRVVMTNGSVAALIFFYKLSYVIKWMFSMLNNALHLISDVYVYVWMWSAIMCLPIKSKEEEEEKGTETTLYYSTFSMSMDNRFIDFLCIHICVCVRAVVCICTKNTTNKTFSHI